MKYLKELFLEIKNTITGDDKKAKKELLDIVLGFTAIMNFNSEI